MAKIIRYNGGKESWKGCTDPNNLIVGENYEVCREEVSAWQTNYYLKGIEGYFNSTWFDIVEEEFKQTKSFLSEIGFARIHVFPYSKREGTRAAKMPGHLQKSVKEERAKELIELGHNLEMEYVHSMIGKKVDVLMEDDGTGYTGNYVRVKCEGVPGEMKTVTIYDQNDTIALGK